MSSTTTLKTPAAGRADRLLALAADEYRRMPVAPAGFRAVLNAVQWVRILRARARLRRHADAQAFYEEAYRAIQSLPLREPRQWQAATDAMEMLSDWAATKEPADAERYVREAVDILGRARAGGPLQVFEERPLWTARKSRFCENTG